MFSTHKSFSLPTLLLVTLQEEDDELRIAAFDARAGNAGAGMTEAMALLKSVELLRGRPSVGDYRVLVSGAIAEQNLPVAVELAQRLHRLMKMGADRCAMLLLALTHHVYVE